MERPQSIARAMRDMLESLRGDQIRYRRKTATLQCACIRRIYQTRYLSRNLVWGLFLQSGHGKLPRRRLLLRSATAAPVAPVDLHASSVNRTMKSLTPNSFDQTLSTNASNDGDAAAFTGYSGTQTGSLAMSGPTLLLQRGNGDMGRGWCDIVYSSERATGPDPLAPVPKLMR